MTAEVRFRRPPVRQVELTVYLDAMVTLQVSHLARLIDDWRPDYPKTDELPPMSPWDDDAREAFGLLTANSKWPFPTLWLSNESSDQSVRIHSDRFSLLWTFRGNSEASTKLAYPGFLTLRAELLRRYALFAEIVEEGTGERPSPRRVEAEYTNELSQDDAHRVLLIMAGVENISQSAGQLPSNFLGMRSHRCASPETHECTITVGIQISSSGDEPDAFVFLESSRAVSQDLDHWDALDQAHDALIDEFVRVTDAEMHASWGRER